MPEVTVDEEIAVAEAFEAVAVPEDLPEVKTTASRLTSNTGIMRLQSQLDEEKEARCKLEEELKMLKELSTEISAHLTRGGKKV